MIAEQRFRGTIYLNSTVGLSTSWTNRPYLLDADSSYGITPILVSENDGNKYHFCGFYCNDDQSVECLLGIFIAFPDIVSTEIKLMDPQLVWSANRDRPVKANATLQLGLDGNLVLADSDGTFVWSTNTTGKSVSGLTLTEMGNLVLFDKANRIVWQSFDHPTDSLLPGQSLVAGRKLVACVSETNLSQGLLSLAILNRSLTTYIDSDPPQVYFTSRRPASTYFSFDGQALTAPPYSRTSPAEFMKFGPDGHFRAYQWDENRYNWKDISDLLLNVYAQNCGYPMNSSNTQNQSGGKKSRRHTVIIGSTLAAIFGIILSITACFVIFKKRTQDSTKSGDFMDLEPNFTGMLTRFSYNELRIITEDFSRKLGEGGFGSVYEGTLSNGTKIAVKRLDGLGHKLT
uniref:Bulb-type lectin domain-containing protein n=1 Tax=Solanum lycopersicum TaxID=4081 RepID=A0A3Q7HG88_SOLLC